MKDDKFDIFIKLALLLGIFFIVFKAKAEIFTYQDKKGSNVKFKIEDVDLRAASKKCFTYLTNGVYQGEERGLEIIDTCANPIKK